MDDLLFIDIESVQLEKELKEGSELYKSWAYKMKHGKDTSEKEDNLEELYNKNASLYPEFAKICTIVIGKVKNGKIRLKAISNVDERELLLEFTKDINNIVSANKNTRLCGHFIKGYDIPFILTRCIVNGIEPPSIVDIAHLKPWETTFVDTHDLWKATSLRGASLINIAVALGIPSPKDDMAGYETSRVYYEEENGLDRITEYCKKDVITTIHVVNACRFEEYAEVDEKDLKEKAVGIMDKLHNSGKIASKDESHIVQTLESLNDKEKLIANELLNIVTTKKK